jgi:hypothetical protein
MGETMNTDKPNVDEGMVGKEPAGEITPPEMKLWKKTVLEIILIALLTLLVSQIDEDMPAIAVAIIISAFGLLALGLNVLLHHLDGRKESERRGFYVALVLLVTLVPGIISLITYLVTDYRTEFTECFWVFPVFWATAGITLLIARLVAKPKAMWVRIALAFIIPALLLAAMLEALLLLSPTGIDTCVVACKDNLRTIDSAIMQYKNAQGEYPTSLEELVPEYIRETREIENCPNRIEGTYFLDTSTEVPEAKCSAHGGLADYAKLPDNIPGEENSWLYPVLFSAIAFPIVGGGVVIYFWRKKKRGSTGEGEGDIPADGKQWGDDEHRQI